MFLQVAYEHAFVYIRQLAIQLRAALTAAQNKAAETHQVLHRNVQRFRGGLVFKVHRLCVSLNSRFESNEEEEEEEEEEEGAFGERCG